MSCKILLAAAPLSLLLRWAVAASCSTFPVVGTASVSPTPPHSVHLFWDGIGAVYMVCTVNYGSGYRSGDDGDPGDAGDEVVMAMVASWRIGGEGGQSPASRSADGNDGTAGTVS